MVESHIRPPTVGSLIVVNLLLVLPINSSLQLLVLISIFVLTTPIWWGQLQCSSLEDAYGTITAMCSGQCVPYAGSRGKTGSSAAYSTSWSKYMATSTRYSDLCVRGWIDVAVHFPFSLGCSLFAPLCL